MRTLAILAIAFLVVACGGKHAPTTGTLKVEVDSSALPPTAAANITVTGPDAFSETLSATEVFENLKVGAYTVTAPDIVDGGSTYGASVTSSPVAVQAGKSHTVTVRYSLRGPGDGGSVPAPDTGSLQSEIVGLPPGINANVTVNGPGIAQAVLTGTQEFSNIEPGDYIIEVDDVQHGLDEYRPSVSHSRSIRVEAGQTVTETIVYARTYSSMEITVTGLDGEDTAITITGPEEYSETLTGGGHLNRLVPGTYWISSADVQGADTYYEAPPVPEVVYLEAGRHEEVLIEYELLNGTIVLVTNDSDDVATSGSLPYWIAQSVLPGSEIVRIDFDPLVFSAESGSTGSDTQYRQRQRW